MEAVWATTARNQLGAITDYIAEDNPVAAIRLAEEIDRTVTLLERFPNSARIGRIKGTREAVIGSYIIVYRIFPKHLLITQIVHGAQEFPLTDL